MQFLLPIRVIRVTISAEVINLRFFASAAAVFLLILYTAVRAIPVARTNINTFASYYTAAYILAHTPQQMPQVTTTSGLAHKSRSRVLAASETYSDPIRRRWRSCCWPAVGGCYSGP